MKRNIYGITEFNSKIKIGEYDDGFLPVGGRIFYIDSTSTATYKFCDAQGNEISSVAVGDTPAGYKKLTDGNGKEKYYVYHDNVYSQLYWSYQDSGSWVLELLGTSSSLGAGKTNTATVMSANSGAYITDSADGTANTYTVWYKIKQLRDQETGGCTDWYLASVDELEQLRLYQADNTGTVTNFFTNYLLTSTEYDANEARIWANQYSWNRNGKQYKEYACFIRSF